MPLNVFVMYIIIKDVRYNLFLIFSTSKETILNLNVWDQNEASILVSYVLYSLFRNMSSVILNKSMVPRLRMNGVLHRFTIRLLGLLHKHMGIAI
jgi:hypothetical protein